MTHDGHFTVSPTREGVSVRAGAPRRALFAGIAAAILGGVLIWPGSGPARAQAVEDVGSPVRHITVTINKSRTLRINRPFTTAVIGAPEIADVLPMTDSTLYVQGKKIGTTNISVFDPQKHLVAVVDLEVTPDTGSLHSKILATTGSRNINVSSTNGEVILSGEASDAVSAARAVDVATGLSKDPSGKDVPVINAMRVSPSQQVMLKVRFLEVDRNATRDLGVNWFGGNKNGIGVSGLGAVSSSATTAAGTVTGQTLSSSSAGVASGASTTSNVSASAPPELRLFRVARAA